MNLSDVDLSALSYAASMYSADVMRSSAREANLTNIELAKQASAFNAQQAQKQMDFQERMSSTAHQREMSDLIAAGLNPILTATGGQGAQAMAGSSGQAIAANVEPEIKENILKNLAQDVLAARRFQEVETRKVGLEADRTASEIKMNERLLNRMDYDDYYKMKSYELDAAESASRIALNSASAYNAYKSGDYSGVRSVGEGYQNVGRKVDADIYESPHGASIGMFEKLSSAIGKLLNIGISFKKK